MWIPKVGRLPKSKDRFDIMRAEILSLSVTFVYEFEIYRSIFSLTKVIVSHELLRLTVTNPIAFDQRDSSSIR